MKSIPPRPDYYSWTKDAPTYPDWKVKKEVKDQPQVKEDLWSFSGFQKLMENEKTPNVDAYVIDIQENFGTDPVTLVRTANQAISLAADNIPTFKRRPEKIADLSTFIHILKQSLDRLEKVAANPQFGAHGDGQFESPAW